MAMASNNIGILAIRSTRYTPRDDSDPFNNRYETFSLFAGTRAMAREWDIFIPEENVRAEIRGGKIKAGGYIGRIEYVIYPDGVISCRQRPDFASLKGTRKHLCRIKEKTVGKLLKLTYGIAKKAVENRCMPLRKPIFGRPKKSARRAMAR